MPRRAFLVLLLAACRTPPPAPPDEEEEVVEPIPDEGPPATVLFLDSAGRAVPLACAAPGVGLYLDPGDCVELLGDDRTIGDLGNGRRVLGDESPWLCMNNGTKRRAFRIEAAPGRSFEEGDPANDLIVWPSSRSFDATVWQREAEPPPADESLGVPDALLLGTLRIDLDGDGGADVIYSVGVPGGAHHVLGVLSSDPHEVVELMTDARAQLQAYAALDLDGDGRLEVIVSAPFDEGDWTAVERFDASARALAAITGIGCGP